MLLGFTLGAGCIAPSGNGTTSGYSAVHTHPNGTTPSGIKTATPGVTRTFINKGFEGTWQRATGGSKPGLEMELRKDKTVLFEPENGPNINFNQNAEIGCSGDSIVDSITWRVNDSSSCIVSFTGHSKVSCVSNPKGIAGYSVSGTNNWHFYYNSTTDELTRGYERWIRVS